jgi:hypothetical protein
VISAILHKMAGTRHARERRGGTRDRTPIEAVVVQNVTSPADTLGKGLGGELIRGSVAGCERPARQTRRKWRKA